MEWFNTLFLIYGSVLFLNGIFMGLFLPIWSLKDCLSSSERPGLLKLMWTIVIIPTWSIGNIFYACLASDSKKLKNWSLYGLAFHICLIFGIGFLFLLHPDFRQQIKDVFNQQEVNTQIPQPGPALPKN